MKLLFILCICFIIYLYLIAPRIPARRKAQFFSKKVYAHRGLFNNHKKIPENSLPAFKNAVKMGYGIELDVQLTKDKKVVVFHDNTLSRMCGIDMNVRDKTYDELCELCLLDTTHKIPLLKEVLKLVSGRVPLIIEIKLPLADTLTCEKVNQVLTSYTGVYCIESFNTLALKWYRKHRPDVIRGQLSGNLTRPVSEGGFFLSTVIKYLLSNFLSRPDFISYRYLNFYNISFLLNKYLFQTITIGWTVDSEIAYTYSKLKFDSIIFEGFLINY